MQLSSLQGKISYQRVRDLYRDDPVISASVEVILTVFAVSFMMFLALRPTLKIVVELRRKIEDQTEVSQKLNAKVKALQLAQKSLTENTESLGLYKAAVPDGASLTAVSGRIEILAQESGVVIDVFRFGAVPMLGNSLSLDVKTRGPADKLSEGQIVILPIHISVEGNFTDIEKFVGGVEKMDRLLRVTSFSVEKRMGTSRKRGSYLLANIKGEIYYKFVKD